MHHRLSSQVSIISKCRLNSRKCKPIPLGIAAVTCLAVTEDKSVWIGTEKGLQVLKFNTTKPTPVSQVNTHVLSIAANTKVTSLLKIE